MEKADERHVVSRRWPGLALVALSPVAARCVPPWLAMEWRATVGGGGGSRWWREAESAGGGGSRWWRRQKVVVVAAGGGGCCFGDQLSAREPTTY